MTTQIGIENRIGERVKLSLSAVVKAKRTRDNSWKENVALVSISRSGSGFNISHECQVGQLVSLLIAMPNQYRCYDFEKEFYRVWGLIQHCSKLSDSDKPNYHVGVAFVGRKAPPSYYENPLQSYRISGMNEDGTWKIVEAQASFIVRRHPRFWLPLDVSLSALDAEDNFINDEAAITENISSSGAAVLSHLSLNIGDSVKFNCQEFDFSALAIVRNRQADLPASSIIHLEFIDSSFPVEKISSKTQTENVSDEDDEISEKEIISDQNIIEEKPEIFDEDDGNAQEKPEILDEKDENPVESFDDPENAVSETHNSTENDENEDFNNQQDVILERFSTSENELDENQVDQNEIETNSEINEFVRF